MPINGLMAGAADNTQDVEYTPQHPDPDNPEEQIAEVISDDDKAKLVTIITTYRTGWAPDRILRLARYTRNQLMYRGQQILGWDSQQQTWYDAFALYMQSGQQQDGDDTYLERYSNNITQMLGDAYVALICRIYPPTIVMPKNARNPEDIQTAKYALDAISVIQRMNKAHDLQET